MDDLIGQLKKLDQIVILGNSPHINRLNYDLINQMVSIGVNRIGLKYNPDILLWTDCCLFTSDWEPISKEYRDEYQDILIRTKSDIKIFRGNVNSFDVPGSMAFDTVKEFGHEWTGGLIESVSVCTAIHLAMVAKIKTVYVAGVDMADNGYFFPGKQYGSKNGEFRDYDREYQLEQFEKVRLANQHCEIFLCSPKSNISGFKKTDILNERSYA
jgi:hypothetical protein